MNNPAYQRMQHILTPFIIPVSDEFTVKTYRKGSLFFAVVTHAAYQNTNRVADWLNSKLPGGWVVPTVTIAGSEWRINPRVTLEGSWQWLFVKG